MIVHCCTPFVVGSWVTAILISLSANVAHTAKTEKKVQSPFRVVWNYPDYPCQVRNIDFELSKYGFVMNSQRTFVGNEIATLYVSKVGLWPSFKDNDVTKPFNGGIPQLANLTAHLEKLRTDIANLIREGSTGYGVLDQELWRILYELNFGYYKIYKDASIREVRRKQRTSNVKQYKAAAEAAWNKSAREIMEKTLLEAQSFRPEVHWGYYLHPQTWWTAAQTQAYNDRMAWLYRVSTGIYPSIYIKDAAVTPAYMKQRIEETLSEAIRVRAVHSKPSSPVVAYTAVQNADIFFDKSVLDYAIGLPAEMGIDGVIIWGSSNLFKPNPSVKCKAIKKYVHEILGPYVSQLMERLSNCSATKCGDRGRCIRQEYAQNVTFTPAKVSLRRQARAAISEAASRRDSGRSAAHLQRARPVSHENLDGLISQSSSTYDTVWFGTTEQPSSQEQSINEDILTDTDLTLDSSMPLLSQAEYREEIERLINATYAQYVPFSQETVSGQVKKTDSESLTPQNNKPKTNATVESVLYNRFQKTLLLSDTLGSFNQTPFIRQITARNDSSDQDDTHINSTVRPVSSTQGSQTLTSLTDFISPLTSTVSSTSWRNNPSQLRRTDQNNDGSSTFSGGTIQNLENSHSTTPCSKNTCTTAHQSLQASRGVMSKVLITSPTNGLNVYIIRQTILDMINNVYNYYTDIIHRIHDTLNFKVAQWSNATRENPQHRPVALPLVLNTNKAVAREEFSQTTVVTTPETRNSYVGITPQDNSADINNSNDKSAAKVSETGSQNSWHGEYVTSSHIPPSIDEYENFVCQCYADWKGLSCEERNIL